MKEIGGTLFHYASLIWYKAVADLYMETGKSRMGFIWWLIEPIIYMSIFYVVFAKMIPQTTPDFPSFLMCGLVPWRWFQESVGRGVVSISSNSNLMSQVYINKLAFPLITVMVATMKHLVMVVFMLIFVVYMGNPITVAWLALPIVFLAQLLLGIGCTCFVASLEPFYPDLRLFTENILTGLFFVSGVFFEPTGLSDFWKQFFDANPIAVMIKCYRGILQHGVWPANGDLAYLGILAAIFIAVALAIVFRFDRVYPKVVVQ